MYDKYEHMYNILTQRVLRFSCSDQSYVGPLMEKICNLLRDDQKERGKENVL